MAGNNILVNLSNITSSYSNYPVRFAVICPDSLFYNSSHYNSVCSFSSSGLLNMSSSTMNVIANYQYTFVVYVYLSGTSILQTVKVNVNFFKDGGSTNCPRVEMASSYYYD
jgi:hypothetical protein